ncbi:MAG: hypothetical protein LBJ47_10620 [Tannerella sp.]|nr:hypothetical protein [Tannerella sp.]
MILFVNGESLGLKRPDSDPAVFTWDDVNLKKGENVIAARGLVRKTVNADSVVWNVRRGYVKNAFPDKWCR